MKEQCGHPEKAKVSFFAKRLNITKLLRESFLSAKSTSTNPANGGLYQPFSFFKVDLKYVIKVELEML